MMEDILMVLVVNLVPITSVLVAGFLAHKGSGGYGFFLLVALLTFSFPSFNHAS